jgi:hypothetical protein
LIVEVIKELYSLDTLASIPPVISEILKVASLLVSLLFFRILSNYYTSKSLCSSSASFLNKCKALMVLLEIPPKTLFFDYPTSLILDTYVSD